MLLEVQNVKGAQHLRAQVNRTVGTNPEPAVMDIYTGWLDCEFTADSDPNPDTLKSFVPLGTKAGNGNFELQGYPPGIDPTLGGVQAIVSASISNFGRGPDAAFVDSATVTTKTQNFPGFSATVLVLNVDIGTIDGDLNRVSYQVTVLTGATERQLSDLVVNIRPAQTPQ